jgi:hypothetical protein
MNTPPLYNARPGKQISVFIENRVGALSEVIDVLREAGVNMLALSLSEGLDIGYLRITVDQLGPAEKVLRDAGHLCYERDVLLLEVANAPGGLAHGIDALAKAGINIEYAYSASGPGSDRSLIVVRVADVTAAIDILHRAG